MSKLTAAEQQSLAEQKRVNDQYERLAKEGINEARTQTEALREIITILRANAIASDSVPPEPLPEAETANDLPKRDEAGGVTLQTPQTP